jgi:hypothetical protein
MEFRRIIVLANSIKRGGRCVAGREVEGKEAMVGNWLRPISDESEGELMSRHMVTANGSPLEVLDIVDVPLDHHANDKCHPEDWVLATSEPWRHRKKFPVNDVIGLGEKPRDLWLEPRSNTDRVTCDFLQHRTQHQSLYLLRPKNLRVRLWREFNQYKGYKQKKTRAIFSYGGAEFDLSLTDPIATTRYCTDFPTADEPAREFTFPFQDNCLMCVSLTPVLKGYHYKVVATVLGLP